MGSGHGGQPSSPHCLLCGLVASMGYGWQTLGDAGRAEKGPILSGLWPSEILVEISLYT